MICPCGCGEPAKPLYATTACVPRALTAVQLGHYLEEDRGFTSPCWIWQRSVKTTGYGQMTRFGKPGQLAHRVFYEWHVGSIPAGCELDHLCRVRACVNPAHLEAVPHSVNLRRGPRIKLSAELVREIRQRYEAGDRQTHIAAELGVHPAHVSKIVTRIMWADVA